MCAEPSAVSHPSSARASVSQLLAGLLEYPRAGYHARLECCRDAVRGVDQDAGETLTTFQSSIQALASEDLEELYVRTFEHNPPCALEVGWHLFGENYERGTFLVWMRAQLRCYGLPESTELPDHLTHVLALLDRMPAGEADDFARDCVLPALERLALGLQGKGNPYEHLLTAVQRMLTARHGPPRPRPVPLPLASGGPSFSPPPYEVRT